MSFEAAHTLFLQQHLTNRTGERKRRLLDGHSHAEKLFLLSVWWPSFGNLLYLHPEYEVRDFKDGYRYIDFVYIRGALKLVIEIDGFGSHCRDLDRKQFSDDLIRQDHLVIDGWMVLRFSYDDVKERPRFCQQIIQQFMGKWV